MAGRATLRRVAIFAILFCGTVGVLAWIAGSRSAPRTAGDEGPAPADHPGPLASIAPDLSVGPSVDGSITHDDVKLVDGRPTRYRAWSAAWKKAVPREGLDPDESIQDLDAPHLVLYPEPRRGDTKPVAEGGPETTVLASRSGTLKMRRDVRTELHLAGDVALDRVDPVRGDAHVRTNALDVSLEQVNGVARRRVASAEPVTVSGARGRIEGVGLDGELAGGACGVTLLEKVKGNILVRGGLLAGGSADAKDEPIEVTCAGAAELRAQDDTPRPEDRRWRATFRDRVHVVQGANSLDCDVLEIEFRMGEVKSAASLPPERVVATGHVHVNGRTERSVFDVVCGKSTHSREGATGVWTDVVVFEGEPVMNVRGALGAAGQLGKDADRSPQRLEIRCDGLATMRTARVNKTANAVFRTKVLFENDVVVKQWDDERKAEEVTGEMRAQKATLYGTRLPSGSFQADTLTAEGEGGVDLRRPDLVSHSGAATWSRAPGLGIDKYALAGNPTVAYTGSKAMHPFGRTRTAANGRLLIDCADTIKIDIYGTPANPQPANAPPRPYATFSASPRVVLRELEGNDEIYRITADQVDATIGADRRLEQARAERGAHVWGLAENGQQRDLYGSAIRVSRDARAPGAAENAPATSQVLALGDQAGPAICVVREKDGARHEIRAQRLLYHDDGASASITASRDVVATLDMSVREEERKDLAKVVDGAVRLTADDARVDLAKGPGGSDAGERQLRRVVATGHVTIDGKLNRLVGDDAVYDGATGIAEMTGQDARLVSLVESQRYTSSVNAPLIRAYFDVAGGPARAGQLLRATCPNGGTILRYVDPPDLEGRPEKGTLPRRIQLQSDGPMEVTREEASAVGENVASRIQHLESGDAWIPDATIWCNRAHMTFDLAAPGGSSGAAKERVRTLDASGTSNRPVRLDTPDYAATAARVDVDARTPTLRLGSSRGQPVHVTWKKSGRTAWSDDATLDYVTHEWTNTRFRETE